jgi:glutathione synthase/RimK-type ligase-like ATP-grasp enzyme
METKVILLPYKATSRGANMMAEWLNVTPVERNAAFEPNEPVTVINWGRGDYPRWSNNVVGFINKPDAVMRAINKIDTFRALNRAGVPVCPFTFDIEVARTWLRRRETIAVFCRETVEGREGRGITVARTPEQIVPAVVYTKYIRKDPEFRVHVMNGQAFYSNIKRPKTEEARRSLIRSGRDGWFFAHMDNLPREEIQRAAVGAVAALGLDFGGVDVAWATDLNQAVVFEVNTAPEVGVNTAEAYKRAFKQHYGQYKNNENVPFRDF